MLLPLFLLALGLIIIVFAADNLIDGSASIAYRHHVSPLVVGLTLVAFGTSAPEITITVIAALKKNSAVALGNAIGSNIANIGLVLGIVQLVSPLKWSNQTLRPKFIFLLICMVVTSLLLADGHIGRLDAGILLTLLVAFMVYLFFKYQRISSPMQQAIEEKPQLAKNPWLKIIIGAIFLPLSAALIVKQAVIIAKLVGLSEMTIGLTIIAIGTSLPELVTSITSAIKGHYDLAIGNILGSNVFNLIAVLPFIGLIDPQALTLSIVARDMGVMFLFTFLMLLSANSKAGAGSRLIGVLLLACYIAYTVLLICVKT